MRFYKIAFLEACFNKGYGSTAAFKFLIMLFGISTAIVTKDLKLTVIAGLVYIIGCFFLGWLMYKFKYVNAQIEVGNRFNPFVGEVRNSKLFKHKK